VVNICTFTLFKKNRAKFRFQKFAKASRATLTGGLIVVFEVESRESLDGTIQHFGRTNRFSISSIMSDTEPVDPKACIEESCKSNCVKPLFQYQACVKRVESDETGHKHCTGQYFDYWACVDNCAAPKVFSNLK